MFNRSLLLPPDFKAHQLVRSSSVFDNPTNNTDLVLKVEGRQLHVNKGVLSAASIVFERMFHGTFQEKNADKISLPGKSYDDILEMLLCIYPSELKEITREKVDVLLQLADEYQIVALTRRCEGFLISRCEHMALTTSVDNEEIVHLMYLADRYNMTKLAEKSTDIASQRVFKGIWYERQPPNRLHVLTKPLVSEEDFKDISDKTLSLYLSKRVYYLEKRYEIN